MDIRIETILKQSNEILDSRFNMFLGNTEVPIIKKADTLPAIKFTFNDDECLMIYDVRDCSFISNTPRFRYEFHNKSNVLKLTTHKPNHRDGDPIQIKERSFIDGVEDMVSNLMSDSDIQQYVLEKLQSWIKFAVSEDARFEEIIRKGSLEEQQERERQFNKAKASFLSMKETAMTKEQRQQKEREMQYQEDKAAFFSMKETSMTEEQRQQKEREKDGLLSK